MSIRYQSEQVWSMMKVKQDNDMTNYTAVVWAENDIELLWPIEPMLSVIKTRQDNDTTYHIDAVDIKN